MAQCDNARIISEEKTPAILHVPQRLNDTFGHAKKPTKGVEHSDRKFSVFELHHNFALQRARGKR
jgi:hypothetical protein